MRQQRSSRTLFDIQPYLIYIRPMPKKAPINERIVKVPLPVPLIRRMDEAIIAEGGGFRTRAELMQEAVENLLNELVYPAAAPERVEGTGPRAAVRSVADLVAESTGPEDSFASGLSAREREELELPDLVATALHPPAEAPQLLSSSAAEVRDEPLLGLHNRDYVSIWALHRLARYTTDGPIAFDDYLDRVTKAAWYFGSQLLLLEQATQAKKLAVLFPTNLAKRPSAERGFQSFAVGAVVRQGDRGALSASGPLFAWRTIGVGAAASLPIELTGEGLRLIQDLDGISLELPHPPALAMRFLEYIGAHAPGDRRGFDHVVRVVADGPDREELVRSFAGRHPEWTAATVSSVAQGYVARAREWGLLEPRLVDGRYWLTDTGRELARKIDGTIDQEQRSEDE